MEYGEKKKICERAGVDAKTFRRWVLSSQDVPKHSRLPKRKRRILLRARSKYRHQQTAEEVSED